jgi:hypothetical protein
VRVVDTSRRPLQELLAVRLRGRIRLPHLLPDAYQAETELPVTRPPLCPLRLLLTAAQRASLLVELLLAEPQLAETSILPAVQAATTPADSVVATEPVHLAAMVVLVVVRAVETVSPRAAAAETVRLGLAPELLARLDSLTLKETTMDHGTIIGGAIGVILVFALTVFAVTRKPWTGTTANPNPPPAPGTVVGPATGGGTGLGPKPN